MQRAAVADRIVTYCDALVAFSLVNGLAFLVALGEPDIRCSIAGIAGFVGIVSGSIPVASTLPIFWLGRFERRLRGKEVEDELVVLLGIWAATKDPSCQAALG